MHAVIAIAAAVWLSDAAHPVFAVIAWGLIVAHSLVEILDCFAARR